MDLDGLSKEELIEMIEKLCDANRIQQYLEQKVDHTKINEIKQRIDEVFFPKYGIPHITLSKMERMIDQAEKECEDERSLIEIKIFYMECIIEFTQTYGMMSNVFYEHLLHIFNSVMTRNVSLFQDKIHYLMGCMKFIDDDIYKKMVEIEKEH